MTIVTTTGDIRMKLKGEDPHKVFNIVYRQLDDFRRIYTPLIDEVANIEYVREGKLRVGRGVYVMVCVACLALHAIHTNDCTDRHTTTARQECTCDICGNPSSATALSRTPH